MHVYVFEGNGTSTSGLANETCTIACTYNVTGGIHGQVLDGTSTSQSDECLHLYVGTVNDEVRDDVATTVDGTSISAYDGLIVFADFTKVKILGNADVDGGILAGLLCDVSKLVSSVNEVETELVHFYSSKSGLFSATVFADTVGVLVIGHIVLAVVAEVAIGEQFTVTCGFAAEEYLLVSLVQSGECVFAQSLVPSDFALVAIQSVGQLSAFSHFRSQFNITIFACFRIAV